MFGIALKPKRRTFDNDQSVQLPGDNDWKLGDWLSGSDDMRHRLQTDGLEMNPLTEMPNSYAGATDSLPQTSSLAQPVAGSDGTQSRLLGNFNSGISSEDDVPQPLAPMTDEQRKALQFEPQPRVTEQGTGLTALNANNSSDEPVPLQNSANLDLSQMSEPQGREPVVGDQQGLSEPQSESLRPRTSEDVYNDLQDAKQNPEVKEHSLGKRILSGLWNGYKLWGQGGDSSVGSLIGALAMSGIGSAKSPEYLAELKRTGRENKLLGEFGQLSAVEGARRSGQLQQAQLDYTKQKPEIEREKIRSRIVQEQLKQKNKIDYLRAQNANKEDDWVPFVRDGKVWKLYKNRAENPIEPLIDPDTNQQMEPVEDQLYDYFDRNGQVVKVKGREIVYGENANAAREQSANIYNTTAQTKYQNDIFDWQSDVTTAGGDVSLKDNELAGMIQQDATLKQREDQLRLDVAALSGDLLRAEELKQKQSELTQIQNQRTSLVAQKEQKKGELEKAKQIYEQKKANRPNPPQQTTAVTTGAKTVTRAEVEEVGKNNKMTYEDAKNWAESKGYKVIE